MKEIRASRGRFAHQDEVRSLSHDSRRKQTDKIKEQAEKKEKRQRLSLS